MLQKRLVNIGVALQAAKGVAAAQPQYWFGVKSGKPASWEIDEDPIEVTGSTPLFGDVDRTLVVPGADFTSLLHPRMVGLLLFGALGEMATSGVGPTFTHVITPANDLPYLTFFGRAFGGDYVRVRDCKIDELELSWENAGHLSLAVTAMGVKLNWQNVAFVPGVDESFAAPLFRAAGGTFKVDPAAAVPIARNIVSGSLKIANGTEAVPQSGSVEPSDVAPAVMDVEVGINVAPDDLVDIRKALTGAAAGLEISQVPIYGSFEWLFAIDANTDLKVASSRFQVKPEMPEADPSGGFLEFDLAGKVLQPPTGDAVTVTLRNTVADYVAV